MISEVHDLLGHAASNGRARMYPYSVPGSPR